MAPRIAPQRAQKLCSQARHFSQSQTHEFHASCQMETRLRRNMFAWLNGPGRKLRAPFPGSTNYLGAYNKSGVRRSKNVRAGQKGQSGDNEQKQEQEPEQEEDEDNDSDEAATDKSSRKDDPVGERHFQPNRDPSKASELKPYPLNEYFISQPVLSEQLRDKIYEDVVEKGSTVTQASITWQVDIRRVAAVVRLKAVEKQWIEEGKKLAIPYASAVLGMLPQTPYRPLKPLQHEPINDLPVHPATRRQLFYPTSESRQFTRADAAKVFAPTLLPADDRIPHSELIQVERERNSGMSREERLEAAKAREDAKKAKKEEQARKAAEWEAKNVKHVAGQRWDFKFQNISVQDAGKDGRGRRGVGWRYGVPHDDRKRGLIKIPTSVE